MNFATPRRALALCLITLGCGSSSGDPTPNPPTGACTSDTQCAANEYCDLGAGSTAQPLLDPPCFFACLEDEACRPGDMSCENACAERCGATCPEFCDFACGGFDGVPPDPSCVSACVPDCEADRASTPPPADAGTPPPPPAADAGTPTPPPPPAREGVCRARPTPPPTDAGTTPTDAGTPTADAGTPTAPLTWAGTWNVRATYTARCMWSSAGAPRETALDYTVTARLTGNNDDLTAAFGSSYEMSGTGNDTRLTLSGQFPGRDHNGNSATTVRRDNSVTISLREVIDANTARGAIEGRYDTSGGISCVIQDGGTITFER